MSQPAEGLDAPIDASEHGPTARREPAGRLIGRTVDGRYRITDFIGSGGMGELYVAEHLRLGRQFAVKVLRSELARDRRFVERFEREARTVASLASEHIVGIVDSGSLEEGEPYFVMELLQGEDLRHLLTRMAPLPASRVANLGIDACRGLHVAHSAGLVHRDLKPENLFVTRGDDGRDVVKLLDFGVVKVLAADTATTPGTLVGTARYMAPEQAGTDSPLTATSDVFSLGVILYECLSGSCPFDGETLERVLFKVMNHEPEPLDRLRPEIPLSLARAVQRAIAKDPGKRHRSARAFEEALLAAAGARTPHPPERHTLAESDRTLVDLLGPEPAESVVVERASSSPSRRTAIAAAVVGLGMGALALAQRGVGNPVARPEASAPAPTASAPVVAPGVQPALESARATVKPTEVAPLAAASAEAPVAASAPIEKPTRGLAGGARKLPSPSASAQKSAKDKAQTKPNTQPFVSYDPENPYAGDDTTAR